jgi:excisionase family DNA binding protein
MSCTVEEAGEMLGISRHSAYRAARIGEIPTIRVGRRLVVPLARLNELLGQTEEVTDPERS